MKMKKTAFYIVASSVLAACGANNQSQKITELETVNFDYISKTVSPAEDFFLFANENWIKNNPVPAAESRWGSFNELEQDNNKKLTEILETLKSSKAKKGSKEQLLGDFYASFTNMDARNKNGINPIQPLLDEIIAINSKDQLVGMTAKLHRLGINVLFGYGVDQDMKDVDRNISYFGQGGLGLPNREYYKDATKEDIRKAYKKFIGDVLVMAQLKDEASKQKAVDNIYTIEDKMATVMLKPEEQRIPELTYNKYAKQQLIGDFKNFDFNGYLNGIGSKNYDTLVIDSKKYAPFIDKLIQTESLDAWKDYFLWHTMDHYIGALSQKFVDLNFDFNGKTLSGKKEMKPINERAIEKITYSGISEMLGHAFVDKYFSEEAKKRVNEMVDNLTAAYKERIEKLSWMSETTKKEALVKLSSFGRKLGFPDKWEDFSSLDFKADSYVANLDAIANYEHNKSMNKLTEKVDRDKWEMPAHLVNAYYHPLLNEVAFPAGIMQAPFFDNNYEDAVNYGRIGMVIGHEFTHGFDDMGSKFAADGSFKNWWTEDDRKAFEVKTGIFGETFSQFCPFEGQCVNPNLTMGENIADLGGLTMAFHAYMRTKEYQEGKEKGGYTPAQRFFIAYAQLWKINYTDAELKKRLATDPHSPGMYRVNGPLKNCPEFFEAFGVKEGDAMRNPKDKVAVIW
ncbi:MAG: M13 family metallopeptidase [Crocinitomicaceae bacterium]|nr:M13 family metallopeptidase [Crocinitomicaceae bacterium]